MFNVQNNANGNSSAWGLGANAGIGHWNQNPFAEGGGMFGQGYGTGRQVLGQDSGNQGGIAFGLPPINVGPPVNYPPPPVYGGGGFGETASPSRGMSYGLGSVGMFQPGYGGQRAGGPFGMLNANWNNQDPSNLFAQPLGGQSQSAPAPQQPQSTTPNIQTTITPQNVFTPQQTTSAVNQAIAQAQMQANPRLLMKQLDRPGVSRSAGQLAAIAPQAQDIMSQAALAAQQIPFSDAATNAQNMLRGETARDQEGLGLAQILAQMNAANQGYETSGNLGILGIIQSLLGPMISSATSSLGGLGDIGSLLG